MLLLEGYTLWLNTVNYFYSLKNMLIDGTNLYYIVHSVGFEAGLSNINCNCTWNCLPFGAIGNMVLTNSLCGHIQSTCFSLEKLTWQENIKRFNSCAGWTFGPFVCVSVSANFKLIHPEWVYSVGSVVLMNLRGMALWALTRTPVTAVQMSSSSCCQCISRHTD